MAEGNVSTGFAVHEGKYRVPDLLGEEEFKAYMWDNYRVTVTFEHAEATINVPELAGPDQEANTPEPEETTEFNFTE